MSAEGGIARISRDLVSSGQEVGDTPLIPLKSANRGSLEVRAKLEWYNPFGSLKDRAARWMIDQAEREGRLHTRGKVLIEPTSGNTGIALSGMAAARGYALRFLVPNKVSEETKRVLRSMGAEVEETEDDMCPRVGVGTDQSIALAEALVAESPERYFMPNQYKSDANFLAHYESTGPEIWRDTSGRVTHFVTGIGTGGTITGVGRLLKERNSDIEIVAVVPERDHSIQGLRNLEESLKPEILERRMDLIDRWITVSDEEAFSFVSRLADEDGLFVGPSSGAVMAAVSKLPDGWGDKNVVTIFGDDGWKYRSLYGRLGVFTEEQLDWLMTRSRHLPRHLEEFRAGTWMEQDDGSEGMM